MLKTSSTISPKSSIANEIAKKYSDSRNFVAICSSVANHFGEIPMTLEEEQMAHGLTKDSYNYLKTSLCMLYDGIENTDMVQPVEMNESEKAAVTFLYDQISPRIKSTVEKRKAISEKRSAAGKKGGRPRKANANEPQEQESKKANAFENGVNACENVLKECKNSPSGSGLREETYKENKRRKVFSRGSKKRQEKRGVGEKGLAPLPPFIPPTELLEKQNREIVENSAAKNGTATNEKTVFEIRRQIEEKRPDLTPRRHWQKYRPRLVTDMGVTWEAHPNAEPTEALLAIPCPPDFDTWFPIVISAKRGGVPDAIIDAWSRTGGHYDHAENQYYIDYAKRERAGGITVLLLFRVYNYGFDCVGRYASKVKAEKAWETYQDANSGSPHANTRQSSKNAVAASGYAVVKPTESNPVIEAPINEPETEYTIASSPSNVEGKKPTVALVPQVPPANGIPTDAEKRKVLEDYMIGERGLDLETIRHFGDDAGWDYRRKAWYIAIRQDGHVIRRYLDVPPDSKCDNAKYPRYILPSGVRLSNYMREHMFEQGNDTVFLMEGQIDVQSVHCAGGYRGVGVKSLEQFDADLKSPNLTARNFIIVADRDAAGNANAEKWSKVLAENGFNAHVFQLPEGCRDINCMLKTYGRQEVAYSIRQFMEDGGLTAAQAPNAQRHGEECNPYLDDSWI